MNTTRARAELMTYPDAESLARGAAERILEAGMEAIASRSRFIMALAGGSTPRATYRRLAGRPSAKRLDWSRTYVFWGDERCVPPDHPDSNYGMARKALLDHVSIPRTNVFRIRGEVDPQRAAEEYESALRTFFFSFSEGVDQDASGDRFDLILLGMGADGHTASLFPGCAGLREKERWVTWHYIAKVGAWRVSFTPVLINLAAHVFFLVAGAEKAEGLKEVLIGPYRPDSLPAQIVRPANGELLWMADREAARQIAMAR